MDVNGETESTKFSTCAGFSNSTSRPAVGTTVISGEIHSYGCGTTTTLGTTFDDGFFRLSAGGGTDATTKTYIDLSGFSNISDMDRTMTFGTLGVERMRISNSGNVGIGTTSPDSSLDVYMSPSSTIFPFTIKKGFATSDSSTSYTLPYIYLTSNSGTHFDFTFTSSASGGSAYLVFNGVDDVTSWTSANTTAYSQQVGSTLEYNYNVAVSPVTTGGITGEYLQIYCNRPFKANQFQIRSASNTVRTDPSVVYVFGSTNGTNWTEVYNNTSDKLSFAAAGNTTITKTMTNSTFYNYYRLVIRSLIRVGGSTVQYVFLNELSFQGVYSSLSIVGVNTSNNTCFAPFTTGNVGIGTTNPTSRLHVNGEVAITGSGGILDLVGTAASGSGSHCYMEFYPNTYAQGRKAFFGFGSDNTVDLALSNQNSTGSIFFGTNNATRMKIDQNGNIGIGTTTTPRLLTLSASSISEIMFEATSAPLNQKRWAFGNNVSTFYGYTVDDNSTSSTVNWLEITRSGTSISNIRFPNGNVGIGTTNPTSKLDIIGTSKTLSFDCRFVRKRASYTVTTGDSGEQWISIARIGKVSNTLTGNTVRGSAHFVVHDGNGSNHGVIEFVVMQMFSGAGGQVVLDLERCTAFSNINARWGNILGVRVVTGSTYQGGVVEIRITPSVVTIPFRVDMRSTVSNDESLVTDTEAENGWDLYTEQTSPPWTSWTDNWAVRSLIDFTISSDTPIKQFNYGSTTLYTIENNGNFGIGTTNPTAKLHVNGDTKINGWIYFNNTTISSNGNDMFLIMNNSALIIRPNTGTTAFQSYFETSSLSLAEDALYINSSKNVGIGTTNPTAKLQVYGNLSVIYDVSSQSLEYPPSALSSNTTTLIGQAYGNGTYIVTSSSAVTGTASIIYYAFDKLNNSTFFSGTNYTGNGAGSRINSIYTGSGYTLYGGTNQYAGDYIQIALPTKIKLQSFSLRALSTQLANAPYNFAIFASNDGDTSWTLIGGAYPNEDFSTTNPKTYTINSSTLYSLFRLSVYAKYGGGSNQYVAIDEIKLYGYQNAVTTLQTSNENVGLGTSTPNYQLTLSRDSAAKPGSNTWTTPSDQRLKENIELANLDICYENIKNLPLKRYKYKNFIINESAVRDRTKLGWIAQDVEKVFPKAISVTNCYNIQDCRGLDADQLYAAMYGSVQKLMQKVEALEADRTSLTTEVALLKSMIVTTQSNFDNNTTPTDEPISTETSTT